MRLVGWSAVILGFAALTACAAKPAVISAASAPPTAPTPASTPSADDAVPWIDRPGSMVAASPLPPSPLPTSGPACAAASLAASNGGGDGAAGSLFYTITFTNTTSYDCVLRGTPRVVATEAGKRPVAATPARLFPVVPTALASGGQSTLQLQTVRDCAARSQGPGNWPTDVYDTVTIAIPGGGSVAVHGSFDVECGLYVGEFGVTPPDPVYPTPPLGGATFKLDLPASVQAGDQLRYVVDIANPTDADMTLDPCPSYLQQGPDDPGKTPLQLNCDAVHEVAAGQTVRFAMQLPIPADTPTGPAQVCWTLVDITSGKDGGCGSVEIEGTDTPCASDQLAATIAGPGTTPGPSNMYALKGVATEVSLTLTNRSATACSVRGAPIVAISESGGSPLKLSGVDEGQAEMSPVVVTPPTVVLPPGAAAATHLYWYLPWCAPDPNPVTVTITLPANGATATATPTGGWSPPPCKSWSAGMPGETSADPLLPK